MDLDIRMRGINFHNKSHKICILVQFRAFALYGRRPSNASQVMHLPESVSITFLSSHFVYYKLRSSVVVGRNIGRGSQTHLHDTERDQALNWRFIDQ
jgi:hypothetical protein